MRSPTTLGKSPRRAASPVFRTGTPSPVPTADGSMSRLTQSPQATFMSQVQNAQFNGGVYTNVGRDNITIAHHHHHHLPTPAPVPTTLDIPAILASLPLPNFRKRQLVTFGKATEGTGLWFARGEVLQTWIERGTILWGIGIPGAGKTYLASIVINELEGRIEASNGTMCLAYVYIRYSEPLTIQQILEALVKQIVERHPHTAQLKVLKRVYSKHSLDRTQPSPHELREILAELAKEFETCILAIDGVDEMAPEDQRVLIPVLASLDAKLFLTSRPLPGLQRIFPQATLVDIEVHGEDIEVHLKEAIRRSPALDELFFDDRSLERKVIDIIKDRCGGMFLHADLQLQMLRQCLSIQDAMETLEEFPEDISDIYLKSWARIHAQPPKHAALARMVLLWVVNANREMTIDELRRAVAASQNSQGHAFEAARMVPEATLTSVCCGLVTVDEKTRVVRLIHYTAKDTLEPLLLDLFPEPQALLLSVCITHLIRCGFQNATIYTTEDLDATLHSDPLLNYAYTSWDHHARKSEHIDSACSQVVDFVIECRSYPAKDSTRFDLLGPCHVAAFLGLPLCFKAVEGNVNTKTTFEQATPLILASRRGHQGMVQLLLKHPDIEVNATNRDSETALIAACAEGQEAAVQLLLEHPNVDVKHAADDGSTAIIHAGGRGYVPLVRLLFKHPATNVNAAKKDGWTALMYAACYNHPAAVSVLLENPQIDPNQVKDDLATALLLASINGHAEVVRLLLQHPRIDPNVAVEDGTTPLMFASWNGHAPVVKLLIEHPRTLVNQAKHDGSTGLILAAWNDRKEVVKHLLDRPDIDANLAKVDGTTALFIASEHGYESIVEMLLNHEKIHVNQLKQDG